MKVVVTGGTGQLGRAVVGVLSGRDHDVTVVTRSRSRATGLTMLPRVFVEEGDILKAGTWKATVAKADAVIHLAGKSVLEPRAGQAQEQELVAARMRALQEVITAIEQSPTPPKVLLVASSTTIYGERMDPIDERAAPGSGFLAELWRATEAAAAALRPRLRVVALRYGQLLSAGAPLAAVTDAAALPAPSNLPFSFIHATDAANLTVRALGSRHDGPLNVVATPTTIAGLHKALQLPPPPSGLAKLFKKPPPDVKPVMVLGGQAARSLYAQAMDFYPAHATIDAALKACKAR